MLSDDLHTLYRYNDWANERLIQMLYQVFGEETDLRSHVDADAFAIQETATHIIAAQALWRSRAQGNAPTALLDPAEYPTPLALRIAFGAERARFWSFFESLPDETALQQPIHYTTLDGRPFVNSLLHILQQVLFHSMYHRGQITARLIAMGRGDAVLFTDLIAYYHEFH